MGPRFEEISGRIPFLWHIESKGTILVLGAQFGAQIGNEIGSQNVGVWHSNWQFNTALDLWEEQMYDAIDEGSFVVSADEQFVVILDDPIQVLDIREENNYKIWKSSVRPPFVGSCLLARSGGGADSVLLASGWIRAKLKDYELPPEAIIGVIAEFCAQGMIHWIANGPEAKWFRAGLDHQMIPMSEILRGIDDKTDEMAWDRMSVGSVMNTITEPFHDSM